MHPELCCYKRFVLDLHSGICSYSRKNENLHSE